MPFLRKSINQLIKAGSDFIVLPCNTLHLLLPQLRKEFNIEFIDLIEQTAKEISNNYEGVGIIGSTKTRNGKLYDSAVENTSLIYPFLEEQEELSKIILRILAKEATDKDLIFLDKVIESLIGRGAEKVVLACTDLGNVLKEDPRLIDSTEILIEKIKQKSI